MLKEMISYLEAFQNETSTDKVEDFIIWLNNKLFSAKYRGEHSAHDELLIAYKLLYVNNELKKQTKSVLTNSLVSTVDEYSFLLHLNYQDSSRKMELIELHNIKAPTGIEIIKRLLRNEFIEEFPDEEDKRSRRIKITPKGVNEVEQIKPKMDAIFTRFIEPLSLHEKIQISGILERLIR